MKAIRPAALVFALLFTGSVCERPVYAQATTNKHVTTGEVKEGWAADGTTKVFNLSFAPTGQAALAVYVNGLYQSEPENYALQGKAIIFTVAPSKGDTIRVKYVAEFNG